MLNKIKDKVLHVLRNYCGYYEENHGHRFYKDAYRTSNRCFLKLEEKFDKLSAQYEAKILEYDILDNKYKTVDKKLKYVNTLYKNSVDVMLGKNIDITSLEEYSKLLSDYKSLISEVTNKTPINIEYKLEDVLKYYHKAKQKDYKKYLVAELEEILNIMKQKGIHPQDLIKRIINKANRDLKE